MAWVEGVGGVLLDVDGTLVSGDRPIEGAAAAIARLRQAGVPFRLTTNTTRRPRRAVEKALRRVGIEVHAEEVIAPSILARRRILDSGRRNAVLLVPEDSREDFDGVVPVTLEGDRRPEGAPSPDWVVVGDLGLGFTWEVLDRAFRVLLEGARLLALQKNRYWHDGKRGLVLDAGPFVAALEYAAGVEAEVVGKPAPAFFDLALSILGLPAEQVLVIGDDAENDVGGGSAAGCRTALVRTGKFSEAALDRAGARPELLLSSIADLTP